MIAVNITTTGLTVDGHAGYAKTGNDIICAAVSALAQGLVHSLHSLTDDEISCHIADGLNGDMKVNAYRGNILKKV